MIGRRPPRRCCCRVKVFLLSHPAQRAAMHLYLWASLAGSCLLRPGLSLLGGKDGAGRKYSSSQQHHTPRASNNRRRAPPATSTSVMAAFVAPPPLERHARRMCSSSSSSSSSSSCSRHRHLPSPAAASSSLATRHMHQDQQQCGATARSRRLRLQQPPPPPWRLCAARASPDNDDDYYSDRGRTDPPAAAQRSGRPPVRGNTAGGGRGGGRPGSGAGRGVAVRERSGRGAPPSPSGGGGGGRGGGRGGKSIDQSDPLVRHWQSAKVLVGEGGRGGQGQGQEASGQRRYVQDSAGRSGGRGGGNGRGGGRGRGRGRGRGKGRNQTPTKMYVGSDTVPWYIKEVQDKGLDTQGEFSRWWQNNLDPKANVAAVKEMKVDELKQQLREMGLPTTGLKSALAERLSSAYLRCSLSDDNFSHAQVTDVSANDDELPNCFPQVYEKLTEAELERLWKESRKQKKKKPQ